MARTPAKKSRPAKRAENRDVERVTVENVNVPGYRTVVEKPRYDAMKAALLKVLPKRPPGLTQTQMRDAVKTHLPEALFPGGAKAEWWAKCVQLDLEAKRLVVRDASSKLITWRRV